MNKPTIPVQEVAELLKRAIRGEVWVKIDGPNWDEAFDATVTFLIGGQRVSFRLDGGDLDYAESVQWTDGRRWYFAEGSEDPIDLLSDEEYDDLETALRGVSVLCCSYPEPILN